MENTEKIKQKTAQGIKLDAVFDTLQPGENVKENPVADARQHDVSEKPRTETTDEAKKRKLPKIALITAAVAGLAIVIGVGASAITTLLKSPPPVATQTATQTPQTSPDAASAPAPDLATSAPAIAPAIEPPPGIEVERVKGIEIQDSLYSDAELIERAKMIEALTSARPATKMTCESLANDEQQLFGANNDIRDGLHHRWSTYEKRCNDIGANEYFRCSPTGFSWDLSVPGCELGIESALVLRNDNIRSQFADLPESLKTRFLAILTR